MSTRLFFVASQIELRMFNVNEIKVWCQLKHANIVKFMGALKERGKIVLLTDYVAGTSTEYKRMWSVRQLSTNTCGPCVNSLQIHSCCMGNFVYA